MIDFKFFTLVFLFTLGLAIGSFLNVLIDRWVSGESILGRSYCDYCKKRILWYDLVPVLSFILLRGKTRCCHKKISFSISFYFFNTFMCLFGKKTIQIMFHSKNLFGLYFDITCLTLCST